MREAIHRCKHCKTEYNYTASGGSMSDKLNDAEYCRFCKEIILVALLNIPKRFACVQVPQTEVTIDMAEGWAEAEIKEMAERNNGLISRRVFATSYKLDSNEHKVFNIVRGRNQFDRNTYSYSYWPSKRKEAKVCIFMEKNLLTDTMRPSDEFHDHNEVDIHFAAFPDMIPKPNL